LFPVKRIEDWNVNPLLAITLRIFGRNANKYWDHGFLWVSTLQEQGKSWALLPPSLSAKAVSIGLDKALPPPPSILFIDRANMKA